MESTGERRALKAKELDLKNRLLTSLENLPPFDLDTSEQSRRALSEVLKEAAKKWLWRYGATQLNARDQTKLGTLAYLPVEIRRLIWDHLLRYQLAQHRYTRCTDPALKNRRQLFIPDRGWSVDSQAWDSVHHDIIEIRQDNYFSRPWLFPIRAVSPTIRDEYDSILFSSRVLRFECPNVMSNFISRLSTLRLAQFFHIRVNIFADCNCDLPHGGEHPNGWLASFMSLPPNLRTIVIETGNQQDFVFVARESTGLNFGSMRKNQAARSMSLRKRLVLLDMLINRARRCVPGLVVSMGTWHWEYLYPGKQGLFESLFREHGSPGIDEQTRKSFFLSRTRALWQRGQAHKTTSDNFYLFGGQGN